MNARVPRILMIEDNPGDVDLLQRAIDETGTSLRLQVATDVNAALAWLAEASEPPALIVLDLNLPATHGSVALNLIKGTDGWRDIPVIVLTSSRLPRERDTCKRLGAAAYWVKPSEWDGYVQCALDLGRFVRDGSLADTPVPADSTRSAKLATDPV